MRSLRLLLMAALLSGTTLAAASGPDSVYAAANTAYREGRFAEAASAYESLLQVGLESAELYYNAGNAYYRLGRVGPAVLALERAARLDPTDDDIDHNLRLARLRNVDRIDPVPELFLVTWLRTVDAALPPPVSRTLFVVTWVVCFGSLSVIYLIRSPSAVRAGRLGFFAGAGLSVLFGLVLLLQSTALSAERSGVIMAKTVTARTSPDPAGTDAFVIHEGLTVRLEEDVEGWVRIGLADGKVGWVRTSEVEEI